MSLRKGYTGYLCHLPIFNIVLCTIADPPHKPNRRAHSPHVTSKTPNCHEHAQHQPHKYTMGTLLMYIAKQLVNILLVPLIMLVPCVCDRRGLAWQQKERKLECPCLMLGSMPPRLSEILRHGLHRHCLPERWIFNLQKKTRTTFNRIPEAMSVLSNPVLNEATIRTNAFTVHRVWIVTDGCRSFGKSESFQQKPNFLRFLVWGPQMSYKRQRSNPSSEGRRND